MATITESATKADMDDLTRLFKQAKIEDAYNYTKRT